MSLKCSAAGLAGAVLLLTLIVPGAAGHENIRQAFFMAYPNASGTVLDTVPSRPMHCGVCHYDFAGGGPLNPYGTVLAAVLPSYPANGMGRRQAILSIAGGDPDVDGFTSTVEITATNYANTPTFPGLSPANLAQVTNVSLAEIEGHLVPRPGETEPPVVTVVSPNGGEVLVGNGATTVQWVATDPSGVVRVDLHISTDNGLSFIKVREGLANSGSVQWFVPNRPSTAAILRVVAFDPYMNAGQDDSDAAFTVLRLAGGLVATTLRDFDLPGTQPFETSALLDPMDCAMCHGDYDVNVEPQFNWMGSMMSQAGRDPLFEACLVIANQAAPDSGDLCLRCHMEAGWVRGRSVPTDGSAMLLPEDQHGVSCDVCHRLVDPFYQPGNPPQDPTILAGLRAPPDNFGNGMFVLDPTGGRRGPFADAMTMGHPVVVSPFHREAALCGTCHDVSNPAIEKQPQGNYMPNALDAPTTTTSVEQLMPVERTYSEWLHSAYNTPEGVYAPQFGGNKQYVATCQDCHMRDVTGRGAHGMMVPIRDDLPLHDMTGGSTWLPGLLPLLYPNDPLVNPAALQAGVLRARYLLQNAATLVAAPQADRLLVRVTNQSGHKLPTGYPEGRRVWVNVRFLDAGGLLVGESGAYAPETGVLSADPELKVYEVKPGLDETLAGMVGLPPGHTFHFVLNNKIIKDNRIPPRGFTNADYARFGGAPVGATYADGQHWDDSAYGIPAAATSAVVALYYQSTSKEYIEFLRDENVTNNKGQALYELWRDNGKCPPEPIATRTVPLRPGRPGDLNCDGAVDFSDINPFVLALSDPLAYAVSHPNCNILNGDCNGDGNVGFEDINPFVALLAGS